MWQFTRSTGKRFLHIDYAVDERLDPFKSTEAAAKLLTVTDSIGRDECHEDDLDQRHEYPPPDTGE